MTAAPPIISDDELKRIAELATLAEFDAAAAPLKDNPAAKKSLAKFVKALPRKNFLQWQKTEMLRLQSDLVGKDVTLDTVLQAEIDKLNRRFVSGDMKEAHGLTLEYGDGVLDALKDKMKQPGRAGYDVHSVFSDNVAKPARKYFTYEARDFAALQKNYPDTRMTVEVENGNVVFSVFSAVRDAARADAQRDLVLRAKKVAATKDLKEFIAALNVVPVDSKFRGAVRAQLKFVADDPLLAWQKREVFALELKGQPIDPADINVRARVDSAINRIYEYLPSQFNLAVRGVPVFVGPQARQQLADIAFSPQDGEFVAVRKIVNEGFGTSIIKWMKAHWQEVEAQVKVLPDTEVVFDRLPEQGQELQGRVYSVKAAWQKIVKDGLKTSGAVAAPRTASFRKPQAQNSI